MVMVYGTTRGADMDYIWGTDGKNVHKEGALPSPDSPLTFLVTYF